MFCTWGTKLVVCGAFCLLVLTNHIISGLKEVSIEVAFLKVLFKYDFIFDIVDETFGILFSS